MLKYTDNINFCALGEQLPSQPENNEISDSQKDLAEWSKNKMEKYGLSEEILNDYAAKLKIPEKINFQDLNSVYNFVDAIQEKLRNIPSITAQFDDKMGLLSDHKFGPVTRSALEIAINQSNAKNLLGDIESGLNADITQTAAEGNQRAKTEKAPATYRKPEKSGPWDVSFKWDKEKGIPYKTSCNVRNGESMWTLGSSSAYNLQGETGYGSIGSIGANPHSFYNLLVNKIWPQIESSGIKQLPPVVALLGMGTNGLTSSDDPRKITASVKSNLDGYNKIAQFLRSKGIGVVKFGTLNPYGKKIKAIEQFNAAVRQNPELCVDTNRAVSTPDGKHFKPGYAAGDGLHLGSKKARQAFAAVVQEAA